MIDYNALLRMPGIRPCKAGAVIAVEGDDSGGEMFFLLQGSVIAYKNHRRPDEIRLESYSPGSFFSELTLFIGKSRTATYVAQTDSVLLGITRETVGQLFAAQPELAFLIVEGICRKYDEVNTAYEKIAPPPMPSKKTQAAKKAPAAPQKSSARSTLFPAGHGSYLLPIDNTKDEYLYEETITCPVCGMKFPVLKVLVSKLKRKGTDKDQRVRYQDIEPMYYEVITCPQCLYSALTESFPEGPKRVGARIAQEVAPFREGLKIRTGVERDSFAVFAGYYLAMLCAPICFDDAELIRAGLWQRLSRIYADAADDSMSVYATGKALEDYLYSYERFDISGRQMQNLCFVIGDLYERMGELEKAREFFYLAKTNRAGTAVLKRQAELRMDELKEKLQGR